MERARNMTGGTRPLTQQERLLAQWMRERAGPAAAAFLPQLDQADVTDWRCECGCASIDFRIRGRPAAPRGVHPIADFVFGDAATLSGIFLFESGGSLKGLEMYGLAGDPPGVLPQPAELRRLHDSEPA